MATPHVAGRGSAARCSSIPAWTPWQVKSALMSTAGPAWGDTRAHAGGARAARGRRARERRSPPTTRRSSPTRSRSRSRRSTSRPAPSGKSMLLTLSDAGDGAGTGRCRSRRSRRPRASTIDVPGNRRARAGWRRRDPGRRPRRGRAPASARTTASSSSAGTASQRRVPYAFLVERPALRTLTATPLKKLQTGDTADGTSNVSVYCCPSEPFGPPPDYVGRADERGRLGAPLLHRHQPAGRQLRRLGARRAAPAR